ARVRKVPRLRLVWHWPRPATPSLASAELHTESPWQRRPPDSARLFLFLFQFPVFFVTKSALCRVTQLGECRGQRKFVSRRTLPAARWGRAARGRRPGQTAGLDAGRPPPVRKTAAR